MGVLLTKPKSSLIQRNYFRGLLTHDSKKNSFQYAVTWVKTILEGQEVEEREAPLHLRIRIFMIW